MRTVASSTIGRACSMASTCSAARGNGAGDADERVARTIDVAGHQLPGEVLASIAAHVGAEEQVGDRGRPPLAGERRAADRVQHGQRTRNVLEAGQPVQVEPRCAANDSRLRGGRQPVGIALDDECPAQQREAEELCGSHLDPDGVCVGGNELAEGSGLRLFDRRQQDDRRRRGADPYREDRPAQAHEPWGDAPDHARKVPGRRGRCVTPSRSSSTVASAWKRPSRMSAHGSGDARRSLP